jgi:DNA (cytosine-5)-methyltransferase 1
MVIESDVKKLKLTGNVDVVVGGPPCQGFSRVGIPKIKHHRIKVEGKKRVYDPRRTLYKEFVRVVRSLRPQFFVMENVPTILSFREGALARDILNEFKALGYNTEARVLNAAEYGVPQIRRRAFFIGNRVGVTNPFPKRTHTDPAANPQLTLDDAHGLEKYVTLYDSISDLPSLSPGEGSDEIAYPSEHSLTSYQKWAREGSPALYNHVARNHSGRDRELFRMLREGQKMSDLPPKLRPYRADIFADKIKKQSWMRPSSAVLAHMQKDGLMYVHPDGTQARTFTPREAARIQSFPDWFRFCGPMTQQFKQIGNAVPPLLARRIAEAIRPMLRPLERPLVEYKILTA